MTVPFTLHVFLHAQSPLRSASRRFQAERGQPTETEGTPHGTQRPFPPHRVAPPQLTERRTFWASIPFVSCSMAPAPSASGIRCETRGMRSTCFSVTRPTLLAKSAGV